MNQVNSWFYPVETNRYFEVSATCTCSSDVKYVVWKYADFFHGWYFEATLTTGQECFNAKITTPTLAIFIYLFFCIHFLNYISCFMKWFIQTFLVSFLFQLAFIFKHVEERTISPMRFLTFIHENDVFTAFADCKPQLHTSNFLRMFRKNLYTNFTPEIILSYSC